MELVEVEDQERVPPLVQAFSSSSLDKAVVGLSNLLLQEDFRAHKDLLKWIVANLCLEIEEF